MKGSVIMFVNVVMLFFGIITILLGIVQTIVYIKENRQFKGYKSVNGCVVEHVSKEGHHYFDDEEFGYDAINYDEDDQPFLIEDEINTTAGIVEYVVKGKKYRLLDSISDTNLMPIGKEVIVKYNPRKIKEAFVANEFDALSIYAVGLFLIIIGILI